MCIKMLKSKIVTTALVGSLAFTNVNASGIPVVDAASNNNQIMQFVEMVTRNANEAAHWIEENTQWMKQLQHYASEIQAYKDQLIATSGIKEAIATYQAIDNLYNEGLAAYDRTQELLNNPLSAASVFSKEWAQYMKYDRCANLTGDEARSCYSEFSRMIGDMGSQKEAIKHFEKLAKEKVSELNNKVKGSEDIKESTDVGNAIALEHYKLTLKDMQERLDRWARENQAKLDLEVAIQKSVEAQQTARFDNFANRSAE